jgi:hypothetical protein
MSNAMLEKELLDIPNLPILLEQLHLKLYDEKNQRADFRKWVTDEVKAAFINGKVVMHSPAVDDHNEATGHLYRVTSFLPTYTSLGKYGFKKP